MILKRYLILNYFMRNHPTDSLIYWPRHHIPETSPFFFLDCGWRSVVGLHHDGGGNTYVDRCKANS